LGECEINLTIKDILIKGNYKPSLKKVLIFINTNGMIEIEEGGLADDGESFYFPVIKILTACCTGLDQWLLTQGIKVFVAVQVLQHDTLSPCSIFDKLLSSQIEFKRFLEEYSQRNKEFQDCKQAEEHYKKMVKDLRTENNELRHASICLLL